MFNWLVGLIALAAVVIIAYGDRWTGKKKHSNYFKAVQTPIGKDTAIPEIPDTSTYDSFFKKLNALE